MHLESDHCRWRLMSWLRVGIKTPPVAIHRHGVERAPVFFAMKSSITHLKKLVYSTLLLRGEHTKPLPLGLQASINTSVLVLYIHGLDTSFVMFHEITSCIYFAWYLFHVFHFYFCHSFLFMYCVNRVLLQELSNATQKNILNLRDPVQRPSSPACA